MALITVKAAVPLIAPGTYDATLIGIAPKRMVTQFSKNGEEQDFLEWTWDVDGQTITSLTTVASGPKSRINEYLVALLGADKVTIGANFDEADLVGKVVMVQIVTTEDGFSKIDRLMAAKKTVTAPRATEAAPVATAAPAAAEVQGDDLPF
jgi:hypothetical protein